MTRAFIFCAVLWGLAVAPALAQPLAQPGGNPATTDSQTPGPVLEAPAATEGAAEALPDTDAGTAAPATEEPSLPFDVQPFLTSMVELRGAALTCAPFVGGDPEARTDTIPQFFAMLDQELPELTNDTTQASLRQFIGSQAASLCVDMLNGAFSRYTEAAADYQAQKPEEWPPAPPVQPGQWCSQPFCLDR